MNSKTAPTRGWGLLESLLAGMRLRMANMLIEPSKRNGLLLDVGCGPNPSFLLNTGFSFKVGIDKTAKRADLITQEMSLIRANITSEVKLPLSDQSCDVITMLAVLEHLLHNDAVHLLHEANRLLKPGGVLVVTTPAAWTAPLLNIMARVRLLSPDEIHDHKVAYTRVRLENLLKSSFPNCEVTSGCFELHANIWGSVIKPTK